jgi:hypothetical protein
LFIINGLPFLVAAPQRASKEKTPSRRIYSEDVMIEQRPDALERRGIQVAGAVLVRSLAIE